jgi:hypothetical protein
MIKLEQIRVGSQVRVRGGWGTEPARTVTVEGVDADIKNGRPGIDYQDTDGTGRWAYLTQVDSVEVY